MPGQGKATVREFARALRQNAPAGTYEGIGDAELVHGALTAQPELADLVIADPLAGIEIAGLPPGLPGGIGGPPPVPEPRNASTKTTRGIAMGLRMVPEITGSVIGGVVGAGGALVAGQAGPQAFSPEELVTVPAAARGGEMMGGAIGAGIGEIAAQEFELFTGERTRRSPGVVGAATALGGITVAPFDPGIGTAANVLRRGGQGAAFATSDLAARTAIEEGRVPTAEEFLTAGGIGFGLGTGLGGIEAGTAGRVRRRRTNAAKAEADRVRTSITDQIKRAEAAEAQELAEQAAAQQAMVEQVFGEMVEAGVSPEDAIRVIQEGVGGEGPPPLPRGLLTEGQAQGPATRVTPEGEAIPPILEPVGQGPPPGTMPISRGAGPPPTTADLLESEIRLALELRSPVSPTPRLVTEKGIRLTADVNAPPIFVPSQPRLPGTVARKQPARFRQAPITPENAPPKRFVPSVEQATGGLARRTGQQRLRDIDMTEVPAQALVEDSEFMKGARVAVQEGFDGPEVELYRRYLEQVETAADINAGNIDEPALLLRTIAQHGGIGVAENKIFSGEVSHLLGFRDTAVRTPRLGRAHQYTTNNVQGVRGVVKPRGGRDLDTMREILRDELGLELEAGGDVVNAVERAVSEIRSRGGIGEPPPGIAPDLGPGWWRRGADQDFAASFADVLETTARQNATDMDAAQQQYLRILTGADGRDLELRASITKADGTDAGLPPAGVRPRTLFEQIKHRCG